jgi:hypothetical protein
MVEEFHAGANILLGHFHYVNKGHHPFTLDWDAADTATMADLSEYQTHFIKETTRHVKSNGKSDDQVSYPY